MLVRDRQRLRARAFGAGGSPPLLVEYIVVAGGGGSGDTYSYYNANMAIAGAGAGGYRSSVIGESSGGGASAEAVFVPAISTPYTITVGAGGPNDTNGSNSTFDTIVSTGGGRGVWTNPNIGGSGGGGGSRSATAYLGASGTANQGFAGGDGYYATYRNFAGGGGGASADGGDGEWVSTSPATNEGRGGNGGDGVTSSITGSAVARAGGGGGGAIITGFGDPAVGGSGGTGGGGDGAQYSSSNTNPFAFGFSGTNGAANTGGGAGGNVGKYQSTTGRSGGSGVILLRIPDAYSAAFSGGVSYTLHTPSGYKVYEVTAAGPTDTVTFN